MIPSRRAAYLDALGIQTWVRKELVEDSDVAAGCLRLGPGTGRLLLLCASAEETAGKLAADIARALPEQPVWAWPGEGQEDRPAREVVDEHLFTDLLAFGKEPARLVLGKKLPETLGSARVILAPAMDELQREAAARRALWRVLCERRLVGVR
ncbi:MAG: hypothetical protein GWM87_15100 [Xanthomonadales bacterium]|nr:hypothetical protein [Xanthomonadales bacterium]NIX14115.1 hypothetical protein [Xanthomonadales bacterium]